MKRQIAVSTETREFLIKAFKKDRRTIYNALAVVDAENDLHKRIRRLALERGGMWVTTLPVEETIHCADGVMRQHMANGAEIVADRHTGLVTVRDRHGETVRTWENPRINEMEAIQEVAASL